MINTNQIQQLTELSHAIIQDHIEGNQIDLACPHARQTAWRKVGTYITILADVCNILALTPRIRNIILGVNGCTLLNWWENGGYMEEAAPLDGYDQLLEPVESIGINGVTIPVLGQIDAREPSGCGDIVWHVQPDAYFAEEEGHPSMPPEDLEDTGDDARG